MGLLYSHYETNPIINSNINAVSGTLQKTFRKSYFVKFEKDSRVEHFYFRENKPSRIVRKDYHYFEEYDEHFDSYYYKLEEIIVLQVMLCADNEYLIEAIDKKDYDEMFSNLESKGE